MTPAAPSAPARWMLTHGADLAIRVWGDDCVVHHALSNDTHRLAAWLVPALQHLATTPSAALDDLAALMDAEPETALDVLRQLEQLQLIAPC